MTLVVGVNSGKTANGKPLKDGGCAIVRDGKVLAAISEERVTRKKRAGGFNCSMQYLMSNFGLANRDVDLFVTSTCCEPGNVPQDVSSGNGNRWVTCDHHESHAIQAFYLSPFDSAVVIVLDSGGNILTTQANDNWWEVPREQQSYYSASRSKGLKLIKRDFDKPFDCGVGEVYRAFTHFLGWRSSRFAGNTMALAACGDPSIFKMHNIFDFSKGTLTSGLQNDPNNPIEMVHGFLAGLGISIQPRWPGNPINSEHANLAAWLQFEVEEALLKQVNNLVDETGIQNVCLSGGVAYNCKSLHRLQNESRAENIFVSPASGDHGQCLGNAIYGYLSLGYEMCREPHVPVYLGPNIGVTKSKIQGLIDRLSLDLVVSEHAPKIVDVAATLLSKGCIIGWYQGRSEFGPRALGNRSILASPSIREVKNILNSIKERESFMPFAPAVLASKYEEFFFDGGTPYMSIAVKSKRDEREWFLSAIHKDGSARVQVVMKHINEKFYNLIKRFDEISCIPMLLNTSLNGKGEPIVESIEDALLCFSRMKLDYLVAGDLLVSRRIPNSYGIIRTAFVNKSKMTNVIVSDLHGTLGAAFPNVPQYSRDRFLLFKPYIDLVREGKKTTTIRYRKDGIDYPSKAILSLFPTLNFSHEHGKKIGELKIDGFKLKKYSELTYEDAVNDGFDNLEMLQKTLFSIYGDLKSEELVSIYSISPIWD
ncbi:MAG TPA: carbamoyltransferase C-terminal domain-containing protein [Mariprofundaceae bacterium]|nr:carbamoyltransferase C-terminal domain-containing protein [Mariprofundaceae bacterium]